METSSNITCPVCTLYLRPGMTLESHLLSHPKQKVIEALCKVVQPNTPEINASANEQKTIEGENSSSNMTMFPSSVNPNMAQINPVPMNQSFIYQQFMSSSGTQPLMNQQFVAVPTVFNPQMMCPPYIFQQQQQVQIMSAGATITPFVSPRPMSVLSSNPAICPSASITEVMDPLSNASISEASTNIEERQCDEPVYMSNGTKRSNEQPERPNIIIMPDESNVAMKGSQNGSDNLMIVASSASNIIKRETLINVNKLESNIHSIPNDLEEEEDNNAAECGEMNEDDPDIIIETNGNELLSVTITNVGKSEAIAEEEEDTKDIDRNTENYRHSTTIQTIQNVSKETQNDVNPLLIMKGNKFNEKLPEIEITASSNNNYTQKDGEDNITLIDMSEVDFILPNDFMPSGQSLISRVNDIECLNEANRNDRPPILMSLGEESLKNSNSIFQNKYSMKVPPFEQAEESSSRESLNIRADERMPPRGELSEQESNGASEVGWGSRVYQEGSSGMSTSYDLLARESWEASDYSDTEVAPLQSRIQPTSLDYKSDEVDEPDEVAPNFSCSTCGENFRCPKERRVHQTKEHSATSSSSTVKRKIVIKKMKTMNINKNLNKSIKIEETENAEPDTSRLPMFLKTDDDDEDDKNNEEIDIKENKIEIDCKENILCNTCGELLPTRREFNIHNRKVHGIKPRNPNLACKKCDAVYATQEKFTEHLKVHPLECNICGKNFYKVPNLKIHLRRHTGIRPFKCDVCSKSFFSKQKLQEHSNIHTGNAPVKCTMCSMSFKRYSNLIQHRNRHHLNLKKKIKDYICHCGEVFHSKSKLQWHKETHESKPKGCIYCHEKFIHMASLTRHIRRIHNQRYVPDKSREAENVECGICKGVYLKSSLDAHMQTHTGKRQHSCPICNKEFTTKWNLKLHKWTHASPNSKPYKCEQCQASYIRQNDYISHMNSHKSLRPYTCNYCGCKFIRKYNCIRHVREHEEGKSFTCVICNKSFHRSYYLNEHMRVHSGIRPYSCHICGKSSTTKSNHNKHMKIHHAREPIMTEG